MADAPDHAANPELLAQVVSVFIAQARDKYGFGRFMPDELPLLEEMARLARIELDAFAVREHTAARPTPPSGQAPYEEMGETPAKTTDFHRPDGSLLARFTVGPIKHLHTRVPPRLRGCHAQTRARMADETLDRCPPGICEANALARQRDDLYDRLHRIYHAALSDADLAGMAVRDFLLRESNVAELPGLILGLIPEPDRSRTDENERE